MHLYLHWTPLSPGGTEICVLQAHMHCTGVTGAALKHSLHIHCSLSPQVGTPFSEKLNCTRKEHYLKKTPKHHPPQISQKPKLWTEPLTQQLQAQPQLCKAGTAQTPAGDQSIHLSTSVTFGMPRFETWPHGGQPKNLPLFPGTGNANSLSSKTKCNKGTIYCIVTLDVSQCRFKYSMAVLRS